MGRRSDARERIIKAALELITIQTYSSMGVDAICRKAGVKKGSFYYFFESKADLTIQALEEHWQFYLSRLRKDFSTDIAPLDRILRYFESVYSYNLERKKAGKHVQGCPYFLIGAEMVRDNEDILKKVHGILEGYFSFFRNSLMDAYNDGFIERSKDPESLARLIFAFFEGTLTMACIKDDPAQLIDLFQGTRDILGLKA